MALSPVLERAQMYMLFTLRHQCIFTYERQIIIQSTQIFKFKDVGSVVDIYYTSTNNRINDHVYDWTSVYIWVYMSVCVCVFHSCRKETVGKKRLLLVIMVSP